jgi:hypothetical protein
MGYFDDILAKTAVTDETDRAALVSLAEKYPALRTSVDTTAANLDLWHAWKRDHWDETSQMTVEAKAAVTEAERAKLRVQALEAAGLGGGDMTFEQIEADLKAKGYVRKDDLVAAADPMVVQRVNQSAANIEHFYRKTFTLPAEYMKEFGDAPPQDLMDKMLADYGQNVKLNPQYDPRDSYNKTVAPQREQLRIAAEAKRTADTEKAIADAREEGRKAALLERGMAPGTPGSPVDNFPTPSMNTRTERAAAAEAKGDKLAQDILNRPLGSTAGSALEWLQQQRGAGGVQ